MKILVRNLERTVTEAELLELFQQYGTVEACQLVLDAETGKSKGFAFVEKQSPTLLSEHCTSTTTM
ncbi:RNA recognition motif domain-containing protein [Acinetobacter soli]